MKILDNVNNTVRDDLRVEMKRGSKVSIAAACFSMYAYQELRKQLESVEEFRFIFTSPTFVKEKAQSRSVSSIFPVFPEKPAFTVRNLRSSFGTR